MRSSGSRQATLDRAALVETVLDLGERLRGRSPVFDAALDAREPWIIGLLPLEAEALGPP